MVLERVSSRSSWSSAFCCLGRTIGRAIRQFRETQEKMTAVVQSEIIDPVSEAASAPVKPKKTAATDDDSDADEDAAETAAPAKKETFAERRARLAAEKAASEGAAEGEGAVDEAEGTEPAAAVEPEPAAEPKPEPAEPTTADLYARRPRKRKAVVDQLARELEVEDDAEAAAADARTVSFTSPPRSAALACASRLPSRWPWSCARP